MSKCWLEGGNREKGVRKQRRERSRAQRRKGKEI